MSKCTWKGIMTNLHGMRGNILDCCVKTEHHLMLYKKYENSFTLLNGSATLEELVGKISVSETRKVTTRVY